MRVILAAVTRHPHVHVFVKFGLVGATTAALYFFAMWVVGEIIGLPYIVAVSLAYLASTIFHFLANMHFTFGADSGRHDKQIMRYLKMWLINYLITILVVRFCVEKLHLSPYLGLCVSVPITMCVGYFLGRFWLFKLDEGGV